MQYPLLMQRIHSCGKNVSIKKSKTLRFRLIYSTYTASDHVQVHRGALSEDLISPVRLHINRNALFNAGSCTIE